MLRRDYILRMIEQIGQALARARKQVSAQDFEAADEELDKAFLDLLGPGVDITSLSETELLAKLTIDGPTQMVKEKTLILVALLQEAGSVRIAAGREAVGQACWLKALNLLLTIKLQDADLEFPEFVPKIDFLRDELRDLDLPLPTLAALWRHHEHTGAFARAEDALSDLLEAQPDNPELRSEAKAFYERLLRETDASLESGNLPRTEVETALAELRA
jgi:hypothetical protein